MLILYIVLFLPQNVYQILFGGQISSIKLFAFCLSSKSCQTSYSLPSTQYFRYPMVLLIPLLILNTST